VPPHVDDCVARICAADMSTAQAAEAEIVGGAIRKVVVAGEMGAQRRIRGPARARVERHSASDESSWPQDESSWPQLEFLEGIMDAKRMTDLWNRAIGIGKCKQFSADLSRGDEILGTPRRKRPVHRRAELP
jgi:hypothetical protein